MRVAILFLAATVLAGAADWPQIRGPQRTGISQERGLLRQWPKQGPALLWQLSDIGDGYGSPSVAGGRVYLMSNRGMDNEFVQALSVEDGKTIWTTKLGGVGNPNQQPPYPMATWRASMPRPGKSSGRKICGAISAGSRARGRTRNPR
jgi:outer membrane protein assembly factor BamB